MIITSLEFELYDIVFKTFYHFMTYKKTVALQFGLDCVRSVSKNSKEKYIVDLSLHWNTG